MSRLALYFLGAPRLEREDHPIEVDTRKAIALAAYLALSPGPQARDTLAALLWPDYDEQHARGALRRTLSVLRSALGGEWLMVEQDTIAFQRPPGAWIDVDEFSAAVAAARNEAARGRTEGEPGGPALSPEMLARLARAADLYRGDFLAGFTLRDSPDFDDWQFLQGEALRRDLAYALERLVQGYADTGELERAIACGRRWLALDPLHEPAHRQLMRLYSAAGQRSAALRQYQECVRVLQRELGVAPLAETTRVYQEIKEQGSGKLSTSAGVEEQGSAKLSTSEGAEARRGRGTRVAAPGPVATGPSADLNSVGKPQQVTFTPLLLHSSTPLPFVGREAEWERLVAAYAAAGRGGRLIVIEGEAGIGKTRLAEEFLAYAASQGAAVAAARCYQGEANLAYGPFVALLRAVAPDEPARAGWLDSLPSEHLAEAARLLPELKGSRTSLPPPPLDGPGAQARFFEGLRQVLAAASQAGRGPAVFFIDDNQWMDAASRDFLAYLVRRLGDRPLCLLLAWRSDEVEPGDALRRLLAEAQRAGLAAHLTLSRLALKAVTDLVERLPGGRQAPRLGERLYAETEGLPFFLAEYLAALAAGAWSEGDEADGPGRGTLVPGGVRDLIHARLAAAGEASRQLLSTAAVIGRSFDFDTLRDASGRAEEETVAGIEELLAHGLIREVAPGLAGSTGPAGMGTGVAYDFAHEKLRAVVYEETSLARRRLLHRRIGETLLARSRAQKQAAPAGAFSGAGQGSPPGIGPGPLASSIAQHYHLAGQDAEAAEYYRLAGEHARSLYANVEALAHFQAALALGHPDTAGLHEAIGDVQALVGDYGSGLASYGTAAALSPGSAPTLEHKLGMLRLRRGEWELASGHFGDALAALGEAGSPSLRAHLLADWSLAAHRQGQAARALELASSAHDLAVEAGDRHALAQAENTLGILAKSRGDLDAACGHLEVSLDLAEALSDPAARVAALNNLALAEAERGDRARALALVRQALALCAAQGDRHREAALHNNLADLLHADGEHEKAMSHLKQAVALFADIRTEAAHPQPEIWKLAEW